MQQRTGVIVKMFFPKKQKIAVFDDQLGKIMCVPKHERLCLGAIINYTASEQNNIHFIHSTDMIAVPFNLAHDDILFLHHVLELLYYFVPIGSGDVELFHMIRVLYDPKTWTNTSQFKKIFLCKLFVLLGMYPEDDLVKKPFFYRVASLSVDMIAHETIDLESEQSLEQWLLRCIKMHPCVDYFKTIHFLTENRMA